MELYTTRIARARADVMPDCNRRASMCRIVSRKVYIESVHIGSAGAHTSKSVTVLPRHHSRAAYSTDMYGARCYIQVSGGRQLCLHITLCIHFDCELAHDIHTLFTSINCKESLDGSLALSFGGLIALVARHCSLLRHSISLATSLMRATFARRMRARRVGG